MEEQSSVSKVNHLIVSVWKTIQCLLDLLKTFQGEQLKLEGDQVVRFSAKRLMATLNQFSFDRDILPAVVKGCQTPGSMTLKGGGHVP